MRKKFFSGILVISLLASSFAAANVSAASTDEQITLTMLDHFVDSDFSNSFFKERIEVFKEEHPNVTLEEETLNTSDLATKVQTLAAANELPDIFLLKGQMAKSFVESGYVMDLSDILAEDSEWTEGFHEGAFSNFEIQGGTYAIPHNITNTFAFYNTELFAQAGIESFPTTWDELIETCKQLLDAGITPIVLGNSQLWPAESIYMSTLGNRCTGNEWYESLRNNLGAAFTDEEFVMALQKLYDLAEAGAFNTDVNSIDPDAQRAAFMNGQAAIMFEGSWGVATLDANMDLEARNKIELAPMPAVEGGKGDANAISGGSGWGFAVNAQLDESKMQAVTEFLKTVIGSELATKAAVHGTVCAYTADEFEVPEENVMARKYMELIEGRPFVPVYDHQLSTGIMDVMQSGLQEILNNSKTAEDLAEELQAEYERENS